MCVVIMSIYVCVCVCLLITSFPYTLEFSIYGIRYRIFEFYESLLILLYIRIY